MQSVLLCMVAPVNYTKSEDGIISVALQCQDRDARDVSLSLSLKLCASC